MANFGDLVGAFMQNGMTPSGGNRIGSALEQLQRSGFGGIGAAGSSSSGAGGLLGGILGAVQGGLGQVAQSPGQAGGLGALVGSLLGGGKGAVQGGMLAVLASVAMKALSSAGEGARLYLDSKAVVSVACSALLWAETKEPAIPVLGPAVTYPLGCVHRKIPPSRRHWSRPRNWS